MTLGLSRAWMARGSLSLIVLTSTLASTLCLLASPAFAAPTTKMKSGKTRVRILSYNVKGLPSIINSYDKGRFKVIGEMLAERRRKGTAPQIVMLQEAFIKPTLAIQKISGYPYMTKGPDAGGKLLNGGIYLLSEFPLQAPAKLSFPKNSCATFDCFSNKGVQFARVRLPTMPFDISILNTHTQSSGKHDKVRMNQFAWLNYFLRSNVNYNDPYRAVIFGGDFNSYPNRPSHNFFRDLAALTSVGEECLAGKTHCEIHPDTDIGGVCEASNDQFFYAQGKNVRIRPLHVERNFTEQFKGKTLSDHLGYEVLFEIAWSS